MILERCRLGQTTYQTFILKAKLISSSLSRFKTTAANAFPNNIRMQASCFHRNKHSWGSALCRITTFLKVLKYDLKGTIFTTWFLWSDAFVKEMSFYSKSCIILSRKKVVKVGKSKKFIICQVPLPRSSKSNLRPILAQMDKIGPNQGQKRPLTH